MERYAGSERRNEGNSSRNDDTRRGLIVGRYQMFHNGHLNTLKFMDAQKDIDEIILGIGSSQYDREHKNWEMPWITNPFTYEEREDMIREALKGQLSKPLIILPIQDQHNIVRWTDYIIHKLPKFDVYFSNTRSEIEHFTKRGYNIRNLPVTGSFHAQTIREMIALGEDWKDYVPKGVYDFIMKIDGGKILRELFQEHPEEIIEAHNFFPDMEWRTFEKLSEKDRKKIEALPVASKKEYIDDYFIHPDREDINIKFRSGILKIKNDLDYQNGLEKTATYSYKFPMKAKALEIVLREIKLPSIGGNTEYVEEKQFLEYLGKAGFENLQISKEREVRFHDACAIDTQKIRMIENGVKKGEISETIGLESRSRNKIVECIKYFGLDKYIPKRYTEFLSGHKDKSVVMKNER